MDQLSLLISIEQYAFTKTFSLYILSYYLHLCLLRLVEAIIVEIILVHSSVSSTQIVVVVFARKAEERRRRRLLCF